MNNYEIQRTYLKLTSFIENKWADCHVPPDVQNYYLLAELIATGKFELFLEKYGALPIDADFAEIGKSEYLGQGTLTNFEAEVCELWNKFVNRNIKFSAIFSGTRDDQRGTCFINKNRIHFIDNRII